MESTTLLAVCLGLLILVCALLILVTVRLFAQSRGGSEEELEQLLTAQEKLQTELEAMRADMADQADARQAGLRELSSDLQNAVARMAKILTDSQTAQIGQLNQNLRDQQASIARHTLAQLAQTEQRMAQLETANEARMNALRDALEKSVNQMRTENTQKLEQMRQTVDEKLQTTLEKRIAESFKTVSEQLEQVYKGLGEMQNLASDVGGLKKVLSGVKTRGILGEVQLGAILQEILAPEQYETNAVTIPGSTNRVEFAVRLPGPEGTVLLPIDSKFPGDTYAHLQEASLGGDAEAVAAARKDLETVLRSEAKDIYTKYVEPPYTTNFGILFLPFEGLYAEVVNMGLLEQLQNTYHVNVAGPSTMAALLNSLQMGFRTLAIQKRSNEVWQVLGAVKTEFGKFEDGLTAIHDRLNRTEQDLETLLTTRTRAINRRLREVQALDAPEAERLLQTGGQGENTSQNA